VYGSGRFEGGGVNDVVKRHVKERRVAGHEELVLDHESCGGVFGGGGADLVVAELGGQRGGFVVGESDIVIGIVIVVGGSGFVWVPQGLVGVEVGPGGEHLVQKVVLRGRVEVRELVLEWLVLVVVVH